MNRAEFNKLVKDQERMVIGEIKKIVPDINPEDLQEVTQDVWIAAWETRSGYTGTAAAQSWLGGVARNQTRKWVRAEMAHKRQQIVYEHDLPNVQDEDGTVAYYDAGPAPHAPSAEDVAVAEERIGEIEVEYSKLTPLQRRVINLKYNKGLSNIDIAASLGTSPSVVSSLLSTLRAKLSR